MEGPVTSRAKKIWLTGLVIAVLLALALGYGAFKSLRKPAPLPPAPPPIEEPAPGPPPVDDATRTTVGKMAAILDGIANYAGKNKGALPVSLAELNRGYSSPEITQDGWGGNIYYLVDMVHKTFFLRSAGADRMRETADDISVANEDVDSWIKNHEQVIEEWKTANPSLYKQMTMAGMSAEELKKLETARKAEEEKKMHLAAEAQAQARRAEEERQKQEAARAEQERQQQLEAARREEEARQARAREEAQQRRQALSQSMKLNEDFSSGLSLWDAPDGWQIIREKNTPVLKVQGMGLLKQGNDWDNYQAEFEIKISKEAAGWLVRAANGRNFYLFKLSSEKARALPKNSLVKYVFSDGAYLNSLKNEEAPGAAGIVPLSAKVRAGEYIRVRVVVKGSTITHFINGSQVDAWTDDTFAHGRFGFNSSAIESAIVRKLAIQPAE